MAMDFKATGDDILAGIGGKDNVLTVQNCMTRLRFALRDKSLVNEDAVKAVDAVNGTMYVDGQYQVIIGTDVSGVCDYLTKEQGIDALAPEGAADDGQSEDKKSILNVVSQVFLPMLPAFIAAGMIQGFMNLFNNIGIIDPASTTSTILWGLGQGMFNFLPFFLAVTMSRVMKVNEFVSLTIAAAIMAPSIAGLAGVEGVTIFGIPATIMNYVSSVFPIVFGVALQGLVEHALDKGLPRSISWILNPIITVVVVSLAVLLVIGPVTTILSNAIANGLLFLLGVAPVVTGFVYAAIMPILTLFGLHNAWTPIMLNNFATLGYEPLGQATVPFALVVAGMLFGVALKTSKDRLRGTSLSTGVTALFGITEPGLYGVIIENKVLLAAACLINGIGGAILVGAGTHLTSPMWFNVFTIPVFVSMCGVPSIIAMAIEFVLAFLAGFLLTKRNEA